MNNPLAATEQQQKWIVDMTVPVRAYVHADTEEEAKVKAEQHRLVLRDGSGLEKWDGWSSGLPTVIEAHEVHG